MFQRDRSSVEQAMVNYNLKYGGNKQMVTIAEDAKQFEPKSTTKNIADLPEVSTDLQIKIEKGKNNETGEEFEFKYVELNGDKYRIPGIVIGSLKVILAENPNLKKFKVKKTGQGLETRYTVIPLS